MNQSEKKPSDPLFEYLVRMADDRLILGHRLSEWCGHAPILEEDIALANLALDYLGQATALLEYAAANNNSWNNADHLAYWRNDRDFRNIKMVELPNGDFAFTIARQFLFSVFSRLFHDALQSSKDSQLGGMASKALKEDLYHVRHSRDWILRLGDGTDESHQRLQQAIDDLWTYTGELFYMDGIDEIMNDIGIGVNLKQLRTEWDENVSHTLIEATIDLPDKDQFMMSGGRNGLHTEHLGYLLEEMQFLTRSHPDASW